MVPATSSLQNIEEYSQLKWQWPCNVMCPVRQWRCIIRCHRGPERGASAVRLGDPAVLSRRGGTSWIVKGQERRRNMTSMGTTCEGEEDETTLRVERSHWEKRTIWKVCWRKEWERERGKDLRQITKDMYAGCRAWVHPRCSGEPVTVLFLRWSFQVALNSQLHHTSELKGSRMSTKGEDWSFSLFTLSRTYNRVN